MSAHALASSSRAEPPWLRHLLGATLVFDLVDAILTLSLVTLGVASEANPLMASALEAGPLLFMFAKLALVSTGVLFLWRERARPLAVVGSVTVFAVYAGIMIVHLQSVEVLARVRL